MDNNFDDIKEAIRIEFIHLIDMENDGYIVSLDSLYKWVENSDFYKNYITNSIDRNNFNARVLRVKLNETKDKDDLTKDFIMRKHIDDDEDIKINIPWFSIKGFKKLCMTLSEDKSKLVRDYFLEIEKSYVRVLQQPEEINKKEFDKLKKDMQKYKNSADNKQLKLEVWQKDYDKLLGKVIYLDDITEKAKTIAPIIYDKNAFNEIGKPERKELMLLRKKHMKEISVYIVNPDMFVTTVKTVKSSKNKSAPIKPSKKMLGGVFPESETSDNNNDEASSSRDIKPSDIKMINVKACRTVTKKYTKRFNEYTFEDIKEMHPPLELYYCIGVINGVEKDKKYYNKVCTIYVLNKDHLKDIKDELNDDVIKEGSYKFKTIKKDIHVMHYTQLEEIRSRHLDNRHCDLLRQDFD